ncbi:MAG TPA: alkaline phosphatase family protein [Thermoanaerobaculia bacterium]
MCVSRRVQMKSLVLVLSLLAAAIPIHAQALLPRPDHIVIVIDENKSFSDVIGSKDAPYLNALAQRGALLTNFTAAHHPSQPNYIDFFAGTPLGVCDDSCIQTPFAANNLGAAILGSPGRSFAGYVEDLPAKPVCDLNGFAKRHCPWMDFSNIPASATRNLAKFPKDFRTLPTVSIVIPNVIHDMHDGKVVATEVKAGDRWLRMKLGAYERWAETHNSLLIITWDEDSNESYKIQCPTIVGTTPPANRIPTIIAGQHVMRGSRPATAYTHHDLLRTILDMYGIPRFAGAASASDIVGIWQ